MITRSLPTQLEVRTLFGDLVGRTVTVSPGGAVKGGACVAVYVNDHDHMASLAFMDLPLAGFVGGALALLPPGGVEDMVAEKDLSPIVIENVQEVANVLAALFNVPGASHVKLSRVFGPKDTLTDDVSAAAATIIGRLDLTVAIAGYGQGLLSLVLADEPDHEPHV